MTGQEARTKPPSRKENRIFYLIDRICVHKLEPFTLLVALLLNLSPAIPERQSPVENELVLG
jgi:hypothetical protein